MGLAKAFEASPKNSAGSVSFDTFRTICKSLSGRVQEGFIGKMYRLAWGISKGVIDCRVFLVTAHECGFFYHCLQLRGLERAPLLSMGQDILPENDLNCKQVFDSFVKLRQSLSMVKEITKTIGVPEIIDNLARLEELMNHKGQEPLEYYHGLSLVDIFRHMWMLILNVQIIFEEMNKQHIERQVDFMALPKATESFLDYLQGLLIQRVSTKFAVRKIQKIWKAKAKKAIAVTATVIKSIALFKRKLKKK